MKKVTLSILTLALAATSFGQALDRSMKPKPGPAPEIKLGKTESFTLPNGLRVFVVENHKLPVIACNIELDIKPELEGDMAGYRDMMSELLLSGTKTRSKEKLNNEIDYMGANIDVSDQGISAEGLKKYMDKIFDIMGDIAMNANIPADELEKTKTKTLSALQTEKNEPDAMVRNVSAHVNFGDNHPYGEVPTEQTVKNISVERCNKYYQTYFRPNVAYMAIVGDITMDEVKPLIEKYFGNWQKMDVPVSTYSIPALTATKLTKVAFAPRAAAVQSVVSVTYPVDLKPGTEDVIKARVTNTVLGGGSQGRLFLDLREKHGWTYGAYSSLSADELGGNFSATVKCRNAVSDSAVGAILDEMRKMQTERVEDAALQNSITYLTGSFAINLEDPKTVAQYAINIERYHMPKDYYQNYLKNLSAVTADDVTAMAKKYIHPDNANIVVAGSKEEVAKSLAKYSADGQVDYYDNFGKSIKPTETMAAPSNVTVDDVYKKYIQSIGGEKAINGIKDLKVVSKGTLAMGAQSLPITVTEMKKAGGKMKETVEGMGMVLQKEVLNGATGYVEQQGQKQDLKGDDLEGVKKDADIQSDLHAAKYGIKRTLTGMEKVNDADAYVVEAVDAKGKKTSEYYDVASGYLVKRVSSEESPEGSVSKTEEYGDYREIPGTGGYKIPYSSKESEGPQTASATVQSVDVNKGIADTEFN